MICKSCGNALDEGVLFCPYCGKKVEDMIDLEKKSEAVHEVFDPPVQPTPSYNNMPNPVVPPIPAFENPPKPPIPAVPAFENRAPIAQPGPAFEQPVTAAQPAPSYENAPKPPVRSSQALDDMLKASEKTGREKNKEFFGVGAFVLCLVIIGLLAASTGIFAYLYFSLLGIL